MRHQTGFFHHIGSFLLFAATILLIITCISAPTVHNLSLLEIIIPGSGNSGQSTVHFGSFGYCTNNVQSSGTSCTKASVGYNATAVLHQADSSVSMSSAATDTSNALTKVMILHPVACGLTFIAFLLALGAGVVGSFLSALVALLSFIVTLVVLVTDFVAFGLIHHKVNDTNNATAQYGDSIWTLLVACICQLLGTLIVFFTCCSARLHRRRGSNTKEQWNATAPPPGRASSRRWF